MTASDLRRLNTEFATALGRVDGQRPKFKWARAVDLHYYIHRGTREHQRESGLILVEPHHERHTYREMYGDVWIIAMWRAPMPKWQWDQVFGTQFPYESGGHYYPIDGSELPQGMEPDAELTRMAIRKITEQANKSFAVHLSETKTKTAKAERDAFSRNSDIFDDAMPAFDNDPGTKGHVSFPPVSRA